MVEINIPMQDDCYGCWIRQNMGCRFANDTGWLNDRRDDRCPLITQEPKAVVGVAEIYKDILLGNCPSCNESTASTVKKPAKYCRFCGQAIKWM